MYLTFFTRKIDCFNVRSEEVHFNINAFNILDIHPQIAMVSLNSCLLSLLISPILATRQSASKSTYTACKIQRWNPIFAAFVASSLCFNPVIFGNPMNVHAVDMRYGAMADVGIGQYLVKDGRQLLRLSLPNEFPIGSGLQKSQEIGRQAQEALELIRLRLEQVGFSYSAVWQGVGKDFGAAETLIKKNKKLLLEQAYPANDALRLYEEKLIPSMDQLSLAIREQNFKETSRLQEESAQNLYELRSMKLPSNMLPFDVPTEYLNLPRLNGRAKVEIVIENKNGFRLPGQTTKVPSMTFKAVVDGYHAPITAGNFIDLVDKKIYDNTPLKSEELIVQTTKTENPKIKNSLRKIPLEIFYKPDKEPTYGITSDDDNRALDTQALPFQAYGALGMARDNEDVDSAVGDFFFLKWNQALIAPGRNTLDGYYSCFGYVVENEDFLSQVNSDDKIVSVKVISGIEKLVRP